ncbi:MAG: toxin TcdB middle/N-terminal domain-containing protein [Desulfobacterales bacterium]
MNRRKTRTAWAIAIGLWASILWGIPGCVHADDAPYDPAILPPETITPPLPLIQPGPFVNSGALVLNFPLPLPPGRKAMTPVLGLTYRSGSGNGILGVGWQLPIGVIRRQTKDGLDYRGVRFEHDAEELVPRPDWGHGFYGAKRDSAFRKYRFLGDRQGWEVWDREGNNYHFGRSFESRMENEFGVLAWFLEKAEDANGNWYRIRYTRDAGQVYPAEILYTGHDRLAPAHRVEFVYGSRPDPIESCESRTRVVTARRLEAIRTTATGQPARLFQFLYETGRTGRSRLREIRSEPLPPVRFYYQEGGDGTFRVSARSATEGTNAAGFVFFGSADGDGYPDLFKFDARGFVPYVHVYLADGDGGFRGKVTTRLEGDANTAGFLQVADFDGDGLADILKVQSRGLDGAVFFHRGTGNGNFARGVRSEFGGANDPGRILVGDVVGRDGRLELVRLKTRSGLVTVHRLLDSGRFDSGTATDLRAVLDTGHVFLMDADGDRREDLVRTGTSSLVTTHLAQGDGTFGPPIVTDLRNGPNNPGSLLVGDFNGDGLPDLLKVHPLSSRVSVHYSLGTGAFAPGVETDLGGPPIDAGRIRVADANGDGRADILLDAFNEDTVRCHLSTHGGQFLPAVRSPLPGGSPLKGFLAVANMDGAGGSDLTLRDSYGGFTTLLGAAESPDLLSRVENGLGGTTRFRYRPSSEAENRYLPFPLETVAAIETRDGNGLSFVHEYEFSGGWYDREQAEFRGFARLEEYRPDGSSLETEYHQDEYLTGKEMHILKRGPSAEFLSRTTFAWHAEPLAGEARFVRLGSKSLEQFFDPTVVSRWDFDHSRLHGGLTQLRRSGTGAEETITSYSHRNVGFWNWQVEREVLSHANGLPLRRTRYVYDGRGNLVLKERINDGGPSPEERLSYDPFGNVVEKIDGRGNPTRFEYDALTASYPARIVLPATNGAEHVWKIPRFDHRVGKASIIEDENGNRTLYTFDAAGRLERADYPDGGRKILSYRQMPLPYRVRSSFSSGPGAPQVIEEDFDGLGRRIRTIRYGEKGRAIENTWTYDNRGRVVHRRGPCFAGSSACRAEETVYDPWDRPAEIRRTHGDHGVVTTRYRYAGSACTATDPDGSLRTTVSDHLERLVRVIEHGDLGDLVTEFDYDAAGEVSRIVQPSGRETRFVRDNLGNLLAMTDPDMGTWSYAYDGNGNLVSQTDARGRETVFEYDALNRLTARRSLASGEMVRYDYDGAGVPNGIGRLAAVLAPHLSTFFEAWDEMGRLISETKVFRGDPRRFTTTRQFDAAGNLLALSYPLDTLRLEYTYHPGTNLPHRVLDGAGREIAAFEDYDADGNAGYTYFGNGTETIRAHDPLSGLIKSIRVRSPSPMNGGNLLHLEYAYTRGGDIAVIRNLLSAITRRYTYDSLHRLVAEHSDPPVLVHPAHVLRLRYIYGDSFPFHGPREIEAAGRTGLLEYDENGNMTRAPTFVGARLSSERRLLYDDQNRAARIHQPGVSCGKHTESGSCPDFLEFLYDGLNRRAVKRSSSSFVQYAGPHFEIRNGEAFCHIFVKDLRLAEVSAKGTLYLHKDHLSSTVVVSDENGAKVLSADYSPFGLLRGATPSSPRHGYTDQEIDFAEGLYNFKSRLYDAHLALFLSPDPYRSPDLAESFLFQRKRGTRPDFQISSRLIFQKPLSRDQFSPDETKSIGFNRFAYAHQNPINLFDVDGLWPERIHQSIIERYFEKKIDSSYISEIISGSAFADSPRFQGMGYSHMHAMREPGESVEQAREKMQQYVNEKLTLYYQNMYEGNMEKAYFFLGMGLHPLMDSTSPSHEGFQVWDSSKGLFTPQNLWHAIQEQKISSERMFRTLELINDALNDKK